MRKFFTGALGFAVVVAILAPFSIFGNDGPALAYAAAIPFGGRIIKIDHICSGGIAFTLSPPRPGLYFYPYSAVTYPYGPPNRPGKWALGLANPGGVCTVGPKTYPTQYTVIMIGTSL